MGALEKRSDRDITAAPNAAPTPSQSASSVVGTVVFSLALLGSLAFFGYRERPTEMTIAAGACLLAMFFSRLEAFSEFSGLGIAAKLREAKAQAAEAYATAAQLHGVSEALAEITIGMLANQGLWGAHETLGYKLDRWKDLAQALRKLGVEEKRIAEMRRPLDYVSRHLHAKEIIDASQHATEDGVLEHELRPLVQFASRFVAPGGDFRRVIEAHGKLGGELEQRVLDMEHFEERGELRRRALWEKDEE